jgi:two-component system sensor histidine kinase KdpD
MGALSARRQAAGLIVAVLLLPAVTWGLSSVRSTNSLASDVLVYQLVVVIIALIGGFWPAIAAAIAAGTLLDYYFIVPLYTTAIDEPLHALALIVFVVVAILVSVIVDQAERRSQAARRSMRESETLAQLSGSVLRGDDGIPSLIAKLRESFNLSSVVVERGHVVLHRSVTSEPPANQPYPKTVIGVGPDARLVLTGGPLLPTDQRVLKAFASQIEAGLAHRDLTEEVERARPLEAADRMRVALLAAVGHDLRSPLAAATAAVGSLASTDVRFSDEARAELISTAQISLDRLGRLVSDLLDVSRLEAGVLAVHLEPVSLEEVVPDLSVAAPDDLPLINADPVLLQRILANLVDNARRFSPPNVPPRIAARVIAPNFIEIQVIDHGPGVPPERRATMFTPFQREGDEDTSTGVGLGLALSRGFAEAMDGSLEPHETPGGGLTMVVTLRAAVTA